MKTQRLAIKTAAVIAALLMGAACGGDDDGDDDSAGAGSGGSLPVAGSGGSAAAGSGGSAAGSGGSGGKGAAMSSGGTGGSTPQTGAGGSGGATAIDAGMMMGDAGMMMEMGPGACCSDGDCLCHGDPPSAPTSDEGPFETESYDLAGAGCVYYPTNAEPPFAAVAVSDGYLGTGGCGRAQTGLWGPLYASWGIVTMVIDTSGQDQPADRGRKLGAGIEAFKAENTNMGSPLFGKLSGRYGTSGFSMGGGGTTIAAAADPTLKSNVAIMAYGPTRDGLEVPSLYIFGSSDGLANTMGMATYNATDDTIPKMVVTVNSGHAGQPTAGGGKSGEAGLAFQKVFLEGDERWRPVLLMVDADPSTVK
jgi:hypothetical protein